MKSLELQTFLTGLRLRLLAMALLGMVPLLAFAIFTALPGPQKAPQLAPSVMQILALAALGLFMALWASEKFILAPLRRLDPATEPAGADAAHHGDNPAVSHREQASQDASVYEVEHRIRRADGVYRWMLNCALPLPDATGQKTQWMGTFTDIDDLRQAAARQEKSLSIIRIAGKVAHLGGWTIELPEKTLTWSDENCLIHDLPPGHQPTLEEGIHYFLPEHQALVARYVQACAQHGTPYEFVLPKMTAKGRRIWVRSIGEAVRDADGQIIRIQGAFQDISDQKAAEERMQALEMRLATTLETITDGFCLLDTDWNLTFMNSPAESMTQRRREDILGKNIWQEFPEIVGTRMELEYRKAVLAQRTAHFEAFYPSLNTWFEIHVYPSDTGVAVYFQDVTQRHLDQAQLRLLETAVSRLNDIVIITSAKPVNGRLPEIVFLTSSPP